MAQDYVLPDGATIAGVAIKTNISNALEALRSCFWGAAEPSAKTSGQLWADTTSGWLKIRNAANNAWLRVAPLATDNVMQLSSEDWLVASLSATRAATKLAVCPRAGTVKRLVLLCETASTSSSGNEWQPMLSKRPFSAPGSPVNLFSATVGTFTVLGGVGGGVEFAAHKALTFTPNQNQTVADLDVLELAMTEAGTATTLTNFRALVELE